MPRNAWLGGARAIAVVLGVLTLTFVLLHLAPGDPTLRLLGPSATPAQRVAAQHALGLDRSWPIQYGEWLGRAVRGDFGVSIASGRPVATLLREAWPATAALVVLSLGLTYVIGVIIGTWQANATRRWVDRLLTVATVTVYAMPGYWLGLVLVMLFTYRLRWLPAFGASGLDADFLSPVAQLVDRLRHLALPLLTLVAIGVGGIARYARASMRAVHGSPFLLVARSKGISRWRALSHHQLRNALVPLVTLLGLSLPALFSGTVFVESVFAWPGVGQLMVQGVQARDYPVVMAAATVTAVLVVAGNLLADVFLLVLDPRVRHADVHA